MTEAIPTKKQIGFIGMEACATAHYWARELTKLGHEVRLMPAKDVKAYVKRNKNDAADAEAICEAVRRPSVLQCAEAGHFVTPTAPRPASACDSPWGARTYLSD